MSKTTNNSLFETNSDKKISAYMNPKKKNTKHKISPHTSPQTLTSTTVKIACAHCIGDCATQLTQERWRDVIDIDSAQLRLRDAGFTSLALLLLAKGPKKRRRRAM